MDDKTIRETSAIVVVILFGILVFFAIKPLLFSILWGLILGYIFMPVFHKIENYVKNKTLASTIVLILAILLIVVPLWFVVPMMINQVAEVFRFFQTLDITAFIGKVFPTSTPQFVTQVSTMLNAVVSKTTSAVITALVDFAYNLPLLVVNFLVVCFVFFFTMRDSQKLKEFVRGLSPLSPAKEKILIKHFKDITYSVIYSNFIVGIVQGLAAGLGFYIFGIKNALVLTVLAAFMSILPFAGAFIIWIPVAIYLLVDGNLAIAVAFILYNVIIVSNIDNVLRVYILSKRTSLSPVFALISAVGGLLLFGVIGLILGPLIFAYFIILLDLYREKNLLSLFAREEPSQPQEAKNPETK